jgi:hypothetical protein
MPISRLQTVEGKVCVLLAIILKKYQIWEDTRIFESLDLDYFQNLFALFYLRIQSEDDVSVLLAFDESQVLFI